jgi:hypothetical protein
MLPYCIDKKSLKYVVYSYRYVVNLVFFLKLAGNYLKLQHSAKVKASFCSKIFCHHTWIYKIRKGILEQLFIPSVKYLYVSKHNFFFSEKRYFGTVKKTGTDGKCLGKGTGRGAV